MNRKKRNRDGRDSGDSEAETDETREPKESDEATEESERGSNRSAANNAIILPPGQKPPTSGSLVVGVGPIRVHLHFSDHLQRPHRNGAAAE